MQQQTKTEQLSLQLFTPRSFSVLLKDRNCHDLSVNFSSRIRRGWNVTISRFSGKRTLTIPTYLENAPEEIKGALIEWSFLPESRRRDRKKPIRERKLQLEQKIWNHIESQGIPRRKARIDPKKLEENTRGQQYDLREVFDTVNRKWFGGKIESCVRWGAAASGTSYQTTRETAANDGVHLITIARVYDHEDIPRFAIEAVMHHEMLHIVIPPRKQNGRNVIHGADFKAAERKFPLYAAWQSWERESLPLLARKMRRVLKRKAKN